MSTFVKVENQMYFCEITSFGFEWTRICILLTKFLQLNFYLYRFAEINWIIKNNLRCVLPQKHVILSDSARQCIALHLKGIFNLFCAFLKSQYFFL